MTNDIATIPTLDVGIHYDIPMKEYVADPCPEPSLSKGTMKRLFERSPKHAWYHNSRLNPNAPADNSARADAGSAVHAATMGGEKITYGDFKDFRTNEAKAWRDVAYDSEMIPILKKDRPAIEAAAESARAALKALPGWTDDYETEGVMIWKEGPTWKRGRFDLWHPGANLMVDIKTCTNANPADWMKRTLPAGGYDIQAEHYLRGMRANAQADDNTGFLFLLVEIDPPYCCSLVGLDDGYTEGARLKMKVATARWARCMKSGEWPGYAMLPHWAALPSWEEDTISTQMALESMAKAEGSS